MRGLSAEIGVVTRLKGDTARVELSPTDACKNCAASLFCRPGKDGQHEVTAYNRINAKIGEVVQISEVGNLMLKLALMQFGLPLSGLLAGVFIVHGIDFSASAAKELLMAAGGMVGLCLAGGLARIWAKSLAKSIACGFEITSLIQKPAKLSVGA